MSFPQLLMLTNVMAMCTDKTCVAVNRGNTVNWTWLKFFHQTICIVSLSTWCVLRPING